ncbi:Kinase suppressor of Ras 2 [Lonchura striata]|uniref:Kinase suppressor of Ras 2 n=1 Tax=Lonchura striata TaxID=40157 RepID=A0A218UI42_9PASE|nr:Kinase suppressor of Ras 2 [Lonchura striata domestica]
MDEDNMTRSEEQELSLQKALQQCELVQNMIDISISNLEGLRTKCAASNDLTQKEIRTLESKLVKYFSRQLSCKRKVALQERNAKLEGFPQLLHWFRIVDIRKEEIAPGQLSLEDLLDMTDEQVCATVEKFGANSEECARLNASLSCLRSVHKAGGSLSKQDWTIQWPSVEPGKENSPGCPPEPGPWGRTHPSPKAQPKCGQHHCHASTSHGPTYTHVDRLTVEGHPGLCPPLESGHRSLPPSPRQRHAAHTPPRTPNIVTTVTPPGTPPVRRRNKLKPPGTPPPSSRKLIHLIPGFTALHRSKSHEFQLGHRVDEAHTPKVKKKNKPLNLKIHNSVGSCENIPAQRSPLLSERSLRSFFVGYPPFLPSTPPVHTEATFSANTLSVPRWSPQIPRRDLGNSIKHRFSTKYWMSQTCTVCGKGMLFGLKCKNCKLKCHNKCTKEAPPCHLLIIHRGARLVRTESVPCDINNPLRKPPRYSDLHVSQTLPKTNKLNKDHIPVPYQPDSSSNPSSTTSSTPSSPAPPLPPSATPPSPLHPSPQCPRQQKQFNLPASHYYKYKQQFIFPDVVPETPTRAPQVVLHPVTSNPILEGNPLLQIEVEPTSENEEGAEEVQESEDDFEEMNLSLLSARNFPRKASQTSIFLQEWDIPFEQLEIGELIGKGRFGQVFHGRWHGEVAIRLIDIERDNEDQLKAFKREVMAYRQTRHENVVLFMGACMSPPHLAIITRTDSLLRGEGRQNRPGCQQDEADSTRNCEGNGIPACQGHPPQGPQVQECLLRQREGGDHRLRALQHLRGSPSGQEGEQAAHPERMAVPPGPRDHPAALSRHRGGQAALLQALGCLCTGSGAGRWDPECPTGNASLASSLPAPSWGSVSHQHHLVRAARPGMALQDTASGGDNLAGGKGHEAQPQPDRDGQGDLGHPPVLLGLRAGGETHLHQAHGHAGETAKAQPPPFPPRPLLEVGRHWCATGQLWCATGQLWCATGQCCTGV